MLTRTLSPVQTFGAALAAETPRKKFLWLFLISCCINLVALLASHPSGDPAQLDFDSREYFDLAGGIVQGTYVFDTERTLGHVLVLAFFRLFTGANLVQLQTLLTILSAVAAPLAYLFARRFTKNDLACLTVGAAVAVWPPFVSFDLTLLSETTGLPMLLLFFLSFPSSPQPRRLLWLRWMFSGMLFGLLLFIRPMFLFYVPFLPLVLLLELGLTRRALGAIVAVALGCTLQVAPWSIYVSHRVGRPMLLSANGGETLSGGLTPVLLQRGQFEFVAPDGRRTWRGPGKWLPEHESGYLSAAELQLPRHERDQLLRRRTLDWVAANPGPALQLEVAKLGYMWGLSPFWNGVKQTLFGNVPIVVLEILALLALVRFRRSWRRLAILWTLPLFTSTVALASWGSWRYRQSADLALIVLAVLFVWSQLAPDDDRAQLSD